MQSAATVRTVGTPPSSTNGNISGSARGVFIAQGAWWDNHRDGVKSFDLWNDKGYGGVDVTVSIAWFIV
jgi:hypothetical protein